MLKIYVAIKAHYLDQNFKSTQGHITLSKGNLSESYQYLLNTEVFLTHTYMKIKDF